MSIAVSVVVKPSRFLFAINIIMCVCLVLAGIVFERVAGSDLDVGVKWTTVSILVLAAGLGFCRMLQKREIWRLDISVNGQIRLLKPVVSTGNMPVTSCYHEAIEDSKLVRMMPDSTLWPYLLLLRLCTDEGVMYIVNVLPDSISMEGFRTLSVACRWVAAHNNVAEGEAI
jgi:toxin CptA